MSSLRFKALEMLSFTDFRKDNAVTVPAKLSELFCQNVFSEETMREYLTKDAFTSIQNAIKKGTEQLGSDERRNNCRRSFVCTQTVIVTGRGNTCS